MRAQFLAIALAFGFGGGVAHAQKSTDVIGVSLGMTVGDARKVVGASGEGWVFEPPIDGPADKFFSARKSDKKIGLSDTEFIAFAKGFFVGRQVLFPPQTRPLLVVVQTALSEKYGSPSYVEKEDSNLILAWGFDEQGTFLRSKDAVIQKCFNQTENKSLLIIPGQIKRGLPKILFTPKEGKSSCGVYIQAEVRHDALARDTNEKTFADALTVSIFDSRALFQYAQKQKLEADEKEREAAEQEDKLRNEEFERARRAADPKPKL